MWSIIEQIFPYAISYTVPLLITALGALYCERSGVVNIGLDGLMIIGSFAGALSVSKLQENGVPGALWIGLLVAVIVGVLFSLLHAFASINLNADQTISGTAINMIASALTIFLARTVAGSGRIRIQSGFYPKDIPFLSEIPVIGDLLFKKTYITTWLVLLILVVSIFLLYKTSFGLRLRACGEHPRAADAAGINVTKYKYMSTCIGSAIAGLGGLQYVMSYASGVWSNNAFGDRGWMAIALVIFALWKPSAAIVGSFLFGALCNANNYIQGLGTETQELFKMLPYVVTIIVLVITSARKKREHQPPQSLGLNYFREER
jgi:simple sugar transport system permease protein